MEVWTSGDISPMNTGSNPLIFQISDSEIFVNYELGKNLSECLLNGVVMIMFEYSKLISL